MLGPWGLKILFFYLEHDAIINSIVFIYGIFVVIAHMNYRKICEQIFIQIGERNEKKSSKKKIEVNIDRAIEEKKMFPFVVGPFSLLPRKTSSEAVKKFIVKEKIWKDIVGDKEVIFLDQ